MNIIQVCIAFGIYLALYYCVWVMMGGVQGLVMAQNILFLVPCGLKNPQLNDPFPATDFGLCFPCEIIVFGHRSSV
jgi:hypothetical protein